MSKPIDADALANRLIELGFYPAIISYYALNNRIRRGWSIERMLTEPTHNYRKEG